jgi:type IV fimbrial biogenesis protein FimT
MSAQRKRGFTAIELMIVLTIVGILAVLAVPSFRDLIVRMRIKNAASDLHTSLWFARSEAIKRNAAMVVRPVNAADWSQGWSVTVQAGGAVLTRQDPYPQITFTPTNAAYVAAPLASVIFAANGRQNGSGGAGIALVLTATDYPSAAARCVVLDPSGRPTVRQDRDGDPGDGCN